MIYNPLVFVMLSYGKNGSKITIHPVLILFEDSQQKGQNALQEKNHWSICGFPTVAAFPYHNPGGDFKDYACLVYKFD